MGRVRYSVVVSYQPMSLAELARFIAAEPDFDTRWRLVVEFLKEYHQEPTGARQQLLADAPGPTGDERWDVFVETQLDGEVGAVRGRLHFVSGEQHRMTTWIFLELTEREIQERFGEFSAIELWHFLEALQT